MIHTKTILIGSCALLVAIGSASAGLNFDLRSSAIQPGLGTVDPSGKNVLIEGAVGGTVTLQIWAQITNAAPTNPTFGIQSMLGSVKSSSGGVLAPVTGGMSVFSPHPAFNIQSVAGTVGELTSPADGILDVGSNGTTVSTAFPKSRKDPTSGGTQVGAVFYASNLDPAGATVQPITNGHEFLMGTFTFTIDSIVQPSGGFTLNWAIPAFTTPANRGQIATWTDGTGLNKTGTSFADLTVGNPINFTIIPEPSVAVTLLGGVATLLGLRRRKH